MLAEEMAKFASNQGLGIYDPTGDTGDIYVGILPDTPHDLVSIFPRGGPPMDPLGEYVVASIQFIIRSQNKLSGMGRGQSFINAFHGFNQGAFVVGGLHIIDCLSQTGEPTDIGKDGSDRYEWSINMSVEYRKQ